MPGSYALNRVRTLVYVPDSRLRGNDYLKDKVLVKAHHPAAKAGI
jgi:hypothetical protein